MTTIDIIKICMDLGFINVVHIDELSKSSRYMTLADTNGNMVYIGDYYLEVDTCGQAYPYKDKADGFQNIENIKAFITLGKFPM